MEATHGMESTSDALGSANLDDFERELIRSTSQSEEYLASPVPASLRAQLQEDLLSFVHLPPSVRSNLTPLYPSGANVEQCLQRDWAGALDAGALKLFDAETSKVTFPLRMVGPNGRPVNVTIAASTQEGATKPWYLSYVPQLRFVRTARDAAAQPSTFPNTSSATAQPSQPWSRNVPGKALETWAYLGPWDALLQQLANDALPEAWDFDEQGANGHRFAILHSYLRYTFYRLQCEGKICEDAENGFAAFNTGLVNRTYEPIFACFVPNSYAQPWRFSGFCKQGSRALGKRLVATFNPPPKRAKYFTRKDDLLFDTDRDLIVDRDHILLDNMNRLPLLFLEEELRGNPEALSIVESLKQVPHPASLADAYDQLREIVEGDNRLERRLINRLEDAINLALKRVEWDFRTAVPAFYPTRGTMSLLLPLDLTNDGEPDIALVAELTDSGAYQGQTILTMRMAYNNARLVCRPDSDWLNTSVHLVDDLDDKDDDSCDAGDDSEEA